MSLTFILFSIFYGMLKFVFGIMTGTVQSEDTNGQIGEKIQT